MSFILFSSKIKKKTIIYELTYFSSHQFLDFTKEILLNMCNIYTFIIALFILNSKTSGKYFYLSHIEDDWHTWLELWLNVAEQKRVESYRLEFMKNKIQRNLYQIFESDNFDIFHNQLNSFTQYITQEWFISFSGVARNMLRGCPPARKIFSPCE
jgi:hypothetical protein